MFLRYYWPLLALSFTLVATLPAIAQVSAPPPEEVDAVLVIDGSGSMLVTDPGRLRYEGARLFTQFLKSGDRLAVVGFSDRAQVLRPLSPYDPSQERDVQGAVEGAGEAGVFTDLYTGIAEAARILEENPREGATRIIVLLSDGKMEPDPFAATAAIRVDQLFNEELPGLKSQGVQIHALALSELADQQLLNQIALATDGVFLFAADAEKIHQGFADLFLAVKKPQVVPLTSRGFKIDSQVTEATFYVARDAEMPLTLISPSGEEITAESQRSDVRWFRGQQFDVITITTPPSGDWKMQGIAQTEGFATVLTNLRLTTEWPSSIFAGQPAILQARLFEGEKPIVLPAMTEQVKFAVRVTPTDRVAEPVLKEFLVDDGSSGDSIRGDGIFSYRVNIDEPGEYRLTVVARAPTFERTQQMPFRVRPRLVTLRVVADEVAVARPAAGHGAGDTPSHGEEKPKDESHHGEATPPPDEVVVNSSAPTDDRAFEVILSDEAADWRQVEVKILAVDSERRRITLPAVEIPGRTRTYRARAALLPREGVYTVEASVTAVGRKGAAVKEESQALEFGFRRSTAEAPVEVVVVEKASAEPKAPAVWPHLLVLLLVAAAAGGGGYVLASKMFASAGSKVPPIPAADEVLPELEAFEKAMAEANLDLASPMFTDSSLQFLLRPEDSGAISPAVQQSSAEEPPAESPPPEGGGEPSATTKEEGAA